MAHLSARDVFGTILVLSAVQVVASSAAAAGRVGGALQGLGTVARYLLSPSVPLIPDLRRPPAPKSGGPSFPGPQADPAHPGVPFIPPEQAMPFVSPPQG